MVRSGEFFRAYNRSAWLFQSCITEYKVLRKYVKSLKEEVFYVGCPSSKLLDLIDGKTYLKTEWGIDIELPEQSLPDDSGYDTWKAAVEVEPESKGLRRMKNKLHAAKGHLSLAQRASFRGVLSHYSSYLLNCIFINS